MKGMWDNSECFTAWATVSAGYAMMAMAQEEMDKFSAKRTPVEKMVDQATGYFKDKMEKHIAFNQATLGTWTKMQWYVIAGRQPSPVIISINLQRASRSWSI